MLFSNHKIDFANQFCNDSPVANKNIKMYIEMRQNCGVISIVPSSFCKNIVRIHGNQ